MRNIRLADLRHCCIPVAARVAVVAGPIDFRSDLAVTFPGAAQQMNLAISGKQLEIPKAFSEFDAVKFLSGNELGSDALALAGPNRDRAKEAYKAGEFGAFHLGGGHAASGKAGVNQVDESIVGRKGGETNGDIGSHLAAFAIAAVAASATGLEKGAARVRRSGSAALRRLRVEGGGGR
jgi:hypothetical protein